MQRNYHVVMTLNLVRQRALLPIAVFFIVGLAASVFGEGWVSTLGKFGNAIFLGFVLFGALIDPKYLTPEGKRVAHAETAD
jgi:hypothetical protein